MKRFALLLLFALSIVPGIGYAAQNSGIINGIWFSKEVFFSGEEVTMFTAVQNQTDTEFSGAVIFSVNDRDVATSTFTADARSLVQVSATHTFTHGENNIAARVEPDDGESVLYASAPTRVTSIDRDTDGDGIGNTEDTDDDGDGVDDETELAQGTDPLDDTSGAATSTSKIVEALEKSFPTTTRTAQRVGRDITDAIDPVVQNVKRRVDAKRDALASNIRGFDAPATSTNATDVQDDERSLLAAALASGDGQLANAARLAGVWLLSFFSFLLKHWVWSASVLLFLAVIFFLRRRFARTAY